MGYSNIFSLLDRVIILTGSCGLLGREFAKAIVDFQGIVICADVNFEQAQLQAAELNAIRSNAALAVHCDITSEESINNVIERVLTVYGRIDGLVNNAYPRNKKYGTKYEDIELASWRENVDSHLNGYFNATHKITKVMQDQKHGVVVNMSSIYGLLGPDFSVYEGTHMTMPVEYAAIKGGITNLSRYLSTYLAPYKIRVNTLTPGGIFDSQPESFVNKYNQLVPLGKMADKEDLVGALIFLLSDASVYITGHNLVVDGGWSAK